jgi:hypothetical protein
MNEPKKMYEVQNSILKKDFIPTDAELKQLSSFMLCRWLSNHPYSVEVGNFINSNYNMPIKAQYWLARSLVHGLKFIGLPKKEKEDLEHLEHICSYYKCNIDIAKRYKNILPPEELQKIVDMYTKIGKTK